ncbi:hypothetical protein F4803DRAFT_547905 [Xylaria telfairii]|nr:hypothetical protein F4803DRAFT_547905 [Xylaria telfairii]
MRVTTTAVIASAAAAVKGLSPNWSFTSTTTVTDETKTWYTISTPFLTTITTCVSGTTETITTTKVSISIGTKPPSAIPLATSTNSPTTPSSDSISGAAVSKRAHNSRGVESRSASTATAEPVTQTYSNTQSSTTDDSDAPSTTSSIIGQVDSIVSFPTTTAAGTTTTPYLSSLSLNYESQDDTSSTASADDEDTITIFPPTIEETTFTATYSSSVHTTRSFTVTGFLTRPSTTETIDFMISRPTTSVLYYTDSTSKLHHPSSISSTIISTISMPTFEIPITLTTEDPPTTFATSTLAATTPCESEGPWAHPFPFLHPTPAGKAMYNPGWWWGYGMKRTNPLDADMEPYRE